MAAVSKWLETGVADTSFFVRRLERMCFPMTGYRFCGRFAALLPLGLILLGCVTGPDPRGDAMEERWGKDIQAFERQDQASPPEQGGVLFVGSSSIRMWDLDKSFPDLGALNRGFGGSQIHEVRYFARRIVLPYRPRVIVFYAGDNDVAAGKSPEDTARDYRRFVRMVHRALPGTRIIFVAIKPSISRWALVDTMRDANERIRQFCERHAYLDYADTDTPMIGPDGKPRPELFMDDGLHLNATGYALWTEVLTPLLENALAATK